jgi:hypothetical protein
VRSKDIVHSNELPLSERTSRPHPIWPDFFIVGTQNSATSSLYTFFRQHPEVFMPAMKEPHYFSRLRPIWHMQYPITHVSDQDSYLRLFAGAGKNKFKGEASSSYLWSEEAPAAIHKANPAAKIIIVLRNPIERAHSHYLMDVREGRQSLPFMQALEQDWARTDKGYGVSRLYVELGLYHRQVQRYVELFGRKQVKILLFKQITAALKSKGENLIALAKFLEIDPAPLRTMVADRSENSFGVARGEWVRRLAGSKFARRLANSFIPRRLGGTFAIRRHIFERFLVKPATKPLIDPAANKWLNQIYHDDILALEDYLGYTVAELHLGVEEGSKGAARDGVSAVAV